MKTIRETLRKKAAFGLAFLMALSSGAGTFYAEETVPVRDSAVTEKVPETIRMTERQGGGPMTAAADSYSFTCYLDGTNYSFYPDGDSTGNNVGIWVDTDNGQIVQCGSSEVDVPQNGKLGEQYGVSVTLPAVIDTRSMIRKTLYYGINGPGEWSGWKSVSYSGDGAKSYKRGQDEVPFFNETWQNIAHYATHEVLSHYNDRNDSKNGVETDTGVTGASEFMQFLNSAPEPPRSFIVLRYDGSADEQDMFTWREYGFLKARKKSAVPALTDGNANYTVTGTEYAVYPSNNDADNNRNAVMTITIQGDGSSAEAMLAPGTYYLKETKAGRGYTKDESVHEVAVTASDAVKTVDLTDQPLRASLSVRFDKQSEHRTKITWSNPVFKVQYFDNYTGDGQAKKTWYLEAKNGSLNLAAISDADLAPGYPSDAFFKDAENITSLLGTYVITEEKAPEGFVRSQGSFKAVLKEDPAAPLGCGWTYEGSPQFVYTPDTNTVTVTNEQYYGRINVIKNDGVREGDASMAGIEITIKNITGREIELKDGTKVPDQTDVPTRIVLNADGSGFVDTLPYGTYELRETKANDDYEINSGWRQTITIGANEGDPQPMPQSASLTDTVYHGGLRVRKMDADLKIQTAQGGASLEGAVYRLYNASQYAVNVSGQIFQPGSEITNVTLKTNAQGIAQTANDLLPIGTYAIQEAEPSSGYKLPEPNERIRVSIRPEDKNTIVEANREAMTPEPVIRGAVQFKKVDAETTDGTVTNENVSLEGAQITVYNKNKETVVKPDGTKVEPNGVYEVLTTNANGEASLRGLPFGSYYAVETVPSKGYAVNTEWRADFEIQSERTVDLTGGDQRLKEQVIRGNLSFIKVNIDGQPKGRIPFLISLYNEKGEVIESHVIVSDENGYVNTALGSHTDGKVNSLDQYVRNGVFTDESKLDPTVGVWFGSEDAKSDLRGALVYGTYTITELGCGDNADKEEDLLRSEPFRIETDNQLLTYHPLVDLTVHLTSEAVDTVTGGKIAAISDAAVFADTVSYDHLKTTGRYRMQTVFYLYPTDESPREIGRAEKEFTPDKVDTTETAYGKVTVDVTCDTSFANAGDRIVAMDRLYEIIDGNAILIAAHEDPNDIDQTLYVPSLSTQAVDTATEDHVGSAVTSAKIRDRIEWTNLPDGRVFRIVGTLKDAESGETLTDAEGKELSVNRLLRINWANTEVTEKWLFWQGPKDGVLEMPAFELDARETAGHTIVVCETLIDMDSGLPYITHESLLDEKQSLYYPAVHTTATDGQTEDHTGIVAETDTVVDHVELKNLVVGQEYTVKGTLHYQEDFTDANGNEHKAGDPIGPERSTTFEADDTSMTVEMTFTVDSTLLAGTSAVVFEDLYHKDAKVAVHADLSDAEQTVHYPRVQTSARDGYTETHTGVSREDAVIVDSVQLENLAVGDRYRVHGVLHDSEGDVFLVDGQPVEAEADFTAEEKDMNVELDFRFDGRALRGKELVVYEKLYHAELEVAKHENPKDPEQTVGYPEVHTHASDGQTGDLIGTAGDATIVDEVTYTHLTVGETYTLHGVLINRKTGEPITIDGKPVEVTKEFVPETEDGTAAVTFTLDASLHKGCSTVVFETLYDQDNLLAMHADINDEGQRIEYPDIHTSASDGQTGEHAGTVGGTETVIDRVHLDNLVIGQEYTVKGTLHYQQDFTDMDGISHKAGDPFGEEQSLTFTATAEQMDMELSFTVDTTQLTGATLVVFEDLYHKDTIVVSHSDLNDAEQSVSYPEMQTWARDADGDQEVEYGTEVVIRDRVEYRNLIPGETYEIRGVLMNKATGEPFMDQETGKEPHTVESRFRFVPEEESGYVQMPFTFHTLGIENADLVVFEYLYMEIGEEKETVEEKEVMEHADLENTDQTVHVKARQEVVKTGDKSRPGLWILLMLLGAAGSMSLFLLRRRGLK